MSYTDKQKFDPTNVASIAKYAQTLIDKCLRDALPSDEINEVSELIIQYKNKRKGHFGNLVEEKLFDVKVNSDSQPDFPKAGLELKTAPLKRHGKKTYVAKERLVFSKINYMSIVDEVWANSSFIKKNKLLLILFYLFEKNIEILDYKFKIVKLLDLLSGIPSEDIFQIKKDWESIVNKVKKGEAHKLSEGDTFYLGACTKGATGRDLCDQPVAGAPQAKPRAFSLKQTYLNFLIQDFLKERPAVESVRKPGEEKKTIDSIVQERFAPYIGKTDKQIQETFGLKLSGKEKSYKRALTNRILGVKGNKIAELEKANVTLKVITLEKSGHLKESISFPYFDYCEIINEEWEGSDLYELLTSQKFLFVVFRKIGDGSIFLEKYFFWNFPTDDLPEAQKVWEKTIEMIKAGHCDDLPGISDSHAIHVRPHALDASDKIPTPTGGNEIKKSFWLNAKYIEKQIKV